MRLRAKQACSLYDFAIQVARSQPVVAPSSEWPRVHMIWQSVPSHVQLVDDGLIRFGNVRVHWTHLLTLHHVAGESLVYCPTCMGTSMGAHAVLLLRPCTRSSLSRSQKSARRRLYVGLWPTTALQRQFDPVGHGHRSHKCNVLSFCRPGARDRWASVSVQQLAPCL